MNINSPIIQFTHVDCVCSSLPSSFSMDYKYSVDQCDLYVLWMFRDLYVSVILVYSCIVCTPESSRGATSIG